MSTRLLVALSILGFTLFALANVRFPRAHYYNCDIAEFHPDYPVAVKEECRRILKNAKQVITT